MITIEELRKDRTLLLSKAKGALIGLAIGDSFGDAARMQGNRESYGITMDLGKGSSWSTDDTEFAMLTATTLVSCKGNLTSDVVVDAWLEKVATQDEFKRGGQSEIYAANNLRKGLRPPQSGLFHTFNMSDGTAMRIPPVGIICAGDPDRAMRLAEIDASVSHARDGIWGAQSVAAAVSLAMVDASWEEIFEVSMRPIPQDSWLYYSMTRIREIIAEKKTVLESWMPIHDELKCSTWATTAEAIPAAFASLMLSHDSFKEGLVLACNYGRDADTIGAVAGAILGAKYGFDAIPEKWVEKTRYPSGTCLQFTKGLDILKVAEDLAELV